VALIKSPWRGALAFTEPKFVQLLASQILSNDGGKIVFMGIQDLTIVQFSTRAY
jgi:hypothetical protein